MGKMIVLFICLIAIGPTFAESVMFWQPQTRDEQVAPHEWNGLFSMIKSRGVDTLALQWTSYGEAFADPEGRAFLAKVARLATVSGLNLIVGLHADPLFFDRQKDQISLEDYLLKLERANLRQAKNWVENKEVDIRGWYLPFEIDDENWRNKDRRQLLLQSLQRQCLKLWDVKPVPIYISSFFTGKMSPNGYKQLIESLSEVGVRVWIQDGRGTNRLTEQEIELYLNPVAFGNSAPAAGVIYEIFTQEGNIFKSNGGVNSNLKQTSDRDSVFFSLRYLKEAQDILHR